MEKLFSYGITGKVIDVITNMYKSIKSCVMDSGIQSDFFLITCRYSSLALKGSLSRRRKTLI